MITLSKIESQVKSFQDRFGVDIIKAEQGSMAWLQTRLGVITASNASKAVAKAGSETRHTYMCQLVAEVATGVVEEINSKYTDWGKLHEKACRASYEFEHEVEVKEVSFIFKDENFREGVSVDGLAQLDSGLVPTEFKCPYNTVHYLKFIFDSKIKKEYEWQCQFGMRVLGSEKYHISQYDPRMKVRPFSTMVFERDDKAQTTLNDAIPQFIHEMDIMLRDLGLVYGTQWNEAKK